MTPSPGSADRVVVVGAGTIGLGWAHLFARGGYRVTVVDDLAERLSDVSARLAVTFERVVEAGLVDGDEAARALANVDIATDLEDAVSQAGWVQEAVPERLAVKRDVFARLDRVAPAGCVLASSTSSIAMTDIAHGLPGADRCVVVHPTNPPHLIPLVEVVPGALTSQDVVDRAVQMMYELDRAPIVCHQEIFGFVLNRLQFALVREAMYLVREGVASVADVDRCVSEGLGLRWAVLGPFGVEETNSEDLEAGLTKFGDFFRDIFTAVGQPYDGPDADDVQAIVTGHRELMDGRSHEALVQYRDRMVLELQALKRAAAVA